jgi:hypothetical protein
MISGNAKKKKEYDIYLALPSEFLELPGLYYPPSPLKGG